MNKWLKSAIKAPIILLCLAPIVFLIKVIIFLLRKISNTDYMWYDTLISEWVNYIYWIAMIIALVNLFYQLVKSNMHWKRKIFFASPRLLLILVVILWFFDDNIDIEPRISWFLILLAISFMIITWIEARKKESVEK